MKRAFLSVLFSASLVVPVVASADVPMLLPVVGHLTDASDAPITGSQDVVFRVYLLQTGGSAVWAETFDSAHPDGQVEFTDDGLFQVYLGGDSSNPLDLADFVDNDELWLGIQVGTDNEMSRVRLASVPWAFEAEVCRDIEDLDSAGIQAALDISCPSGQYMIGYDSSGISCDAIALPSTVLETSDIGVSVQAAIDTSTPCNYGIATVDAAAGTVGCSTQAVVNDCGPLAGGGSNDNYLGSDGTCHPAPHSCDDNHTVSGSSGECQGTVPSGAVMFFNLSSCPNGWSELADARGRFIVGLPASGTLAATVGTGLSNEAEMSHTHAATATASSAGAHNHAWGRFDPSSNIWYSYNSVGSQFSMVDWVTGTADGNNGNFPIAQKPTPASTQVYHTDNEAAHTHDVAVTVPAQDTTPPYIQLLACQKD